VIAATGGEGNRTEVVASQGTCRFVAREGNWHGKFEC
jgi:hypothetical protein